MADYVLRTESIPIPSGSGVEAFLVTMRTILRRPRIQTILVEGTTNRITFTFYARAEEADLPIQVELESAKPYHLVRSKSIEELPDEGSPIDILMRLFSAISRDHLSPICFIAHPNTVFWKWAASSGYGFPKHRDEVFGYSVRYDDQVPEDALLLAACVQVDGTLIDTTKTYKVHIGGTDVHAA